MNKLFKDVSGFVRDYGTQIVAIGILFIPGANAFAVGFLSGFIGSGGDLKAGLIGAITAYGFGSLKGAHWLQKGMYGGISSKLAGGSFRDGFLGTVAPSFAPAQSFGGGVSGQITRTVYSALVGGVTAELGGGKFANGARSAGFAYLFASGSRSLGFGGGLGGGASGGVTANGSVAVRGSTFDYTTVGPDGYAEQVHGLLVDIASTDAGASLLTEIAGNGGSVQFRYGVGGASARGSLFSRDTVVTYKPAHRDLIATTSGRIAAQPEFVVAHELHHAWKNTLSCWFGCSRPLILPGAVPRGVNPWEVHAVRYTNLIRSQAGVGYQRTHYDGIAIP